MWGQIPLTGTFSFDGNGVPIDPATGLPAVGGVIIDVRNDLRALQAQTEWPIPTRWELQIGLTIGPNTSAGTSVPWTGGIGAAQFVGAIESAIESATIVEPLNLIFGPGTYPLTAAIAGVPGLGNTFPVIAQQVRVRVAQVILNSDPGLASGFTTTWNWTISTLIGLTAPAIT